MKVYRGLLCLAMEKTVLATLPGPTKHLELVTGVASQIARP